MLYFRVLVLNKILCRIHLTGFSIYQGFKIFQDFECIRVLNMSGFIKKRHIKQMLDRVLIIPQALEYQASKHASVTQGS